MNLLPITLLALAASSAQASTFYRGATVSKPSRTGARYWAAMQRDPV